MRNRTLIGAALGVALLAAPAARAAVWNEAVQGEISGNRNSPSLLPLTVGTNTITATTGGGDLEYLRLSVPAGGRIDSLTLQDYSGNDGIAFIGLQQGTTFTVDANSAAPGDMLGYAHFGTFAGNVGSNLLPAMGTAPGAQGFSPPLTGSNYTLWIQQLGSPSTYTFSVMVTPEPAGGMLVAAVAGLACLRRRR